MTQLIELSLKQKRFKKNKRVILKDFQLSVSAGDSIAVMGESGIGKTSLLNILGLIDQDYEGSHKLFGRSAKAYSAKDQAQMRNNRIGFILQENALIPSLSIKDNICLPWLYCPKDKQDQVFFDELIRRLKLDDLLSQKPGECSGGQRARAVIGRAVLMKPDLILADEPTASLDEENRQEVLAILKDLNRDFKASLITVTHDHAVAQNHRKILRMV
mgnify:FL=1